jgi:hypothetical protein
MFYPLQNKGTFSADLKRQKSHKPAKLIFKHCKNTPLEGYNALKIRPTKMISSRNVQINLH